MLVDRDDAAQRHRSAVVKACREAGFYEIPTDDLDEVAREGHDPEMVEKTLADIEGIAAIRIEELLEDGCPPSDEVRFRLSLFFGLQMARGGQFRRTMDQMARILGPKWLAMELSPEAVRDRLIEQGEDASPARVADIYGQLTGPRRRVSGLAAGQLCSGVNAPCAAGPGSPICAHLARPRVRRAVPDHQRRAGRHAGGGRADAARCREYSRRVGAPGPTPCPRDDADRLRGPGRWAQRGSRRINQLVADQAERWILCHPDDQAHGSRLRWATDGVRDEVLSAYGTAMRFASSTRWCRGRWAAVTPRLNRVAETLWIR